VLLISIWGLGALLGGAKPTQSPDWLAVIHLDNKEAKRELKVNHNNETCLSVPSPNRPISE